jgi:hypothetical protein
VKTIAAGFRKGTYYLRAPALRAGARLLRGPRTRSLVFCGNGQIILAFIHELSCRRDEEILVQASGSYHTCINLFCRPLQNAIGIPAIVNYPKEVYNAGSQNWGIAQDRNGILYFANNQGLLSFDGRFWRKYPLPNKTIARSIAIDEDIACYVHSRIVPASSRYHYKMRSQQKR